MTIIDYLLANFWSIYFSGFIICFVLCKIMRGSNHNKQEDIVVTIKMSLISWVGVLITIGAVIITLFEHLKKRIKINKPPWWL